MSPRRVTASTSTLTAWVRRYLETGKFHYDPDVPSPPPELYAMAKRVLDGEMESLRELWTQHGAEVLRDWRGRGRPWALETLNRAKSATGGKA